MKNRHQLPSRICALLLALAILCSFAVPVATAADGSVTFTQVDNDAVTAQLPLREAGETETASVYADTDSVRVSIFLADAPTLAKFDAGTVSENQAALAYRANLETRQETVTQAISTQALGGKRLDVVWNLTLAANIISANVEYGQIEAIERVPGVEKVLIETRYDPAVVDTDLPADPNMATSSAMIGSSAAWTAGYTGAGTRIAVIDTGTDTDHQSFSAAGFDYSLAKQAELHGKTVEDYNLLEADEIARVLNQLHASEALKGVTAEQLYLNTKLPYAFNYVDKDLEIDHENDDQGMHGSHVAGICTANTYIPNGDGSFSNALQTVKVQGVAPDAQLITMKVFGKRGGAFDSDYLVAIEDAIILKCDSVNLSLGSPNPGMTRHSDAAYQKILNDLEKCGVVVAIAAGNAGSWVAQAQNGGYLYADDISTDMVGSPGSYTNSLCVASIDNAGVTGEYFSVDDHVVVYNQSNQYWNDPLSTLVGEHEYILIDGIGTEEEFAAIADVLEGKIAVCARGTIPFSQKANSAVENGAIATIIYNNQSGVIGMDLSDYEYSDPCVSVTQADGNAMREAATAVTDDSGKTLYYEGSLTVEEGMGSAFYDQEFNTMSVFSSWGVPGSLEMKPEITAPGGYIYSVDGMDPKGIGYATESGTSMATPQVAGMAALVAQYIRENGLAEKTGLTPRQLAQSLLMSTAVPQMEDLGDDESSYYPVIRQGSGLANVGKAIAADSYILMGKDATRSYADGKVKVELGDDPQKTGVYEFSFSIHNLTAEEKTYALSADFFTQDVFTAAPGEDGVEYDYMATWTAPLEADVTFDGGRTVTVAGNGSASVKVKVELTDAQKAELNENYPSGAYIQGFVYAESGKTEEGMEGTSHSIPVLGFYGCWTEPSMFEVGSLQEYRSGQETRIPYLGNTNVNTAVITYANDPNTRYYFGGNPLVKDASYMPERNAINSQNGDQISHFSYSVIRSAGESRITAVNKTTGKTMMETLNGRVDSAFFYTNAGTWMYTSNTSGVKFVPTGVPEGQKLTLSMTLAPEYYIDETGNVRWDELGSGASLTVPMVVDNTAPEIKDILVSVVSNTMIVEAKDNQYVAAVVLYNTAGTKVLAQVGAKQDIEPGQEALYTLDLTGVRGKSFLVQVFDYAMNATTYQVSLQTGGQEDLPEMIAFKTGDQVWVGLDSSNGYKNPSELANSQQKYLAAAEVENMLFAATERGDLYVLSMDDLSAEIIVGNMGAIVTDMAYDASTETLYGVADNHLFSIDKLTGELNDLGEIPIHTRTLACDGNGTFYSAVDGNSLENPDSGFVYAYTLDTLRGGNLDYDFDGDGNVDADDGQAILDYATGVRSGIENESNGDFDGNGKLTARDAYVFFEKFNAGRLGGAPTQITSRNRSDVQSLVWDPNSGLLYGVLFTALKNGEHAYFFKIDIEAGTDTSLRDLETKTTALVVPSKATGGSWTSPTDQVRCVQISEEALQLLKGSSRTLAAAVQPWTATDRSVTWTSANPEVATVDEKGFVTGVAPGETVITATSVLDPTKSASCTVTVDTLNVTLKGALQNDKGNPMLFTWNMETEDSWKPGPALETPLASAVYDPVTDKLYLHDSNSGSWFMHQIDLATGKETARSEASCEFQFAMSDLVALELYNTEDEPGMMAVVQNYLMSPCDPMENTFSSGWNMTPYLSKYTGGTKFVAAAFMGTATNDIGDLCDLIYALDDAGYLWTFKYNGTSSISINYIPTDLELSFPTHQNYQFCSMVRGDDGNLYLSYFTGETNEFYRLVWNEEQGLYASDRIGNVGQDVWPAVLYAVETNGSDTSNAASAVGVLDEAITLEAQTIGISPMSEAQPSEDGKTFAVTVTAKNADGADAASNNGMAVVSYDVSALELTDVTISGDYTAMVTADGTVTFGYVSMEGIAARDPVARLTFTVKDGATPSVTVTHKEINDTALDLTEQLTLGCAHNHTEIRNEKNATDTEDGYTGDTYCADCGLLLVKGEAIPAHCASKSFTDVNTGEWYHEYIDYVVDKGLMQGMGNDKFLPEGTMTRAMLVTVLYRLAGEPEVTGTTAFTDLKAGEYYCAAVLWAVQNGITEGMDETHFAPNKAVTREQMVTFLYRYAKLAGMDVTAKADLSTYADADKVGTYAADAMAWAVANELINGVGNNTLAPKSTATRAQVAAVLMRYLAE
ncbi:MAG: S8 family serine peptidase [Faecousia sp.]